MLSNVTLKVLGINPTTWHEGEPWASVLELYDRLLIFVCGVEGESRSVEAKDQHLSEVNETRTGVNLEENVFV